MNKEHFKLFGVNGLYQGQSAIIGGASSFIDTVDLTLLDTLENIVIIGVNWFFKKAKAEWAVFLDSTHHSIHDNVDYIADNTFLATRYYKDIPEKLAQKATLLFKDGDSRVFPKLYRGELVSGATSAISALHLAAFFGCSEVLLLGIDFTAGYTHNYFTTRKKVWRNSEVRLFNRQLESIVTTYNMPVYQANEKAKTTVPTKKFEDFCHGIDRSPKN